MKGFLPNQNLLEESKSYYASNEAALKWINPNFVEIDTKTAEEKIIHVKPGYCTMKLFILEPDKKMTANQKTVSQKGYQEVRMLDCRGKRE